MNHWQLVDAYKGKTIEVYDGRLVRIKAASVPGNAFCESVDGRGPISEVSTVFLQPDAVREMANESKRFVTHTMNCVKHINQFLGCSCGAK